MRQLRIARTASPTIATSRASSASASSVALTAPSSEFSIGTSARSTPPPWTAMTVSWIVGNGTSSPPRSPAVAARSASSLNVPAGPR